MSIYNCHRQQPQPWMSYISPNKIVYPGECCPALVTGNRCNVDSVEIIYGYLYNWYAATDVRNICAAGWHIPTFTESSALNTYLGGDGGKLKETGTTYWITPNTGATNEVGFNGRGAGSRREDGVFQELKYKHLIWTTTASDATNARIFGEQNTSADFLLYTISLKKQGNSVRPIKDSTTLSHGQTGTYTGNDGKTYRTICIGTQEWLADNLCETLYRDGSPIPEVTDAATWAALTTGARCSYDNDESNAFTI